MGADRRIATALHATPRDAMSFSHGVTIMSLTDSDSLTRVHAEIALPAEAAVQGSCVDAPRAVRGSVTVQLALRHAGQTQVRIDYEDIGAADAPVLLIAGGISADRHVLASASFPQPGWWQSQAGSFDLQRQRIIAIDWLGGDGSLDVPIDSADQADAIAAVLDALGVAGVQAFIGCSYGGMTALQFATRHAHRVQALVVISAAHRAHPFASAWRALQRRAVALGALQCDAAAGLALARELAMLSYRTPEEFAQRFAEPPRVTQGQVRCAAEEYLDACARRYVARTHPTAFVRLSESIDLHRVEPAAVVTPTWVLGVAQDRLVPLDDICELVEHLPNAQLRLLRSDYGHDAFLKEPAAVDALLRTAGCGGAA